MTKFCYVDLFAGIGGFAISMNERGGKMVSFSEIDKTAIQYYCKNHKVSQEYNLGDICQLDKIPYHDILTAGVSCQPWSIAGKKRGFDDPRGRLWDDTLRVLEENKPKCFVFENVRGLTGNKDALNYILNKISEIGYYHYNVVLDSSDFGVLQKRERLYIIGFLEKRFYDKFEIPEPTNIENCIGEEFGIELSGCGIDYFIFNDLRNGENTIHSWDIKETTERQKEICQILLQNRRKKKFGDKDGNPLTLSDFKSLDKTIRKNELDELVDLSIFKNKYGRYEFKNSKMSSGVDGIYRIIMPSAKYYPTLVASDTRDFIATRDIESKEQFIIEIYQKGNYRKITKEEACVIQGFPPDFELPEKRNKWMKLLGNSVAIPVIDKIIDSIIKTKVFG